MEHTTLSARESLKPFDVFSRSDEDRGCREILQHETDRVFLFIDNSVPHIVDGGLREEDRIVIVYADLADFIKESSLVDVLRDC